MKSQELEQRKQSGIGRFGRLGIYASCFCVELAVQGTQPLIVLHFASLGAPPSTIGWLLAFAGTVPMLFSLPLGRLADRVGSRVEAIAGSLICIAGLYAFGASTSFVFLVAALMLSGLGYAATSIAYQSLLSEIDSKDEQLQAFGWLSATSAVGQTLGPAVAGIIADQLNLPAAFSLAAGVAGLSLVGMWTVRSTRARGVHRGSVGQVAETTWWRNPTLLLMASTILVATLVLNIRTSFLPLYLSNAGSSATQTGVLLSIVATSSLLVRSQIGKLVDRLGTRRTMITAFAIGAPALVIIPGAPNYGGWIVAAILLGIAVGIVYPLTMSLAANAVPKDQRGLALGLRFTALRVGSTASPLLFGMVADAGGLGAIFVAASLICVAGAIGCYGARLGWEQVPQSVDTAKV